jgi:hypothetical protein
MLKRTWHNAPGVVCGEFSIEFTSTGYYDPGKTSGLPENCYPPEGEDERTVTAITLSVGRREIELDPNDPGHALVVAYIEDAFQEAIDEAEVSYPERDDHE